MEVNTNKKLELRFREDIVINNNRDYIKTLNNSFLNANFDEIEKFKKQIDACIKSDLDSMIQKICDLNQKDNKKKFGIYVDSENQNKMSSLIYERCMLIDYKNILWKILNNNKNCEGKWADDFKETSNLRVDNLIKLEFCDNGTINNENSLNDVDEDYFAYAKDEKNPDRYFVYFSMLKYLFEIYTKEAKAEAIEEFEKYNVEKMNQIKKQVEENNNNINDLKAQITPANQLIGNIENEICLLQQKNDSTESIEEKKESIKTIQTQNTDLGAKKNLVLEYQSEILELEEKNKELEQVINHPLTKFYEENQVQITAIKKGTDDIKQKWKQQYYKFIFAFMLENPDQIFKLEKTFDKDFPTVDFIEFLIKNSGHENFSHACLGTDNLVKKLKLGVKSELQTKYKNTIDGLGENRSTLINLLLSKDKEETLEYQYIRTANWILFWCGLSVLIVAAAPILALIIANVPLMLPNIIVGIILIIPTLVIR